MQISLLPSRGRSQGRGGGTSNAGETSGGRFTPGKKPSEPMMATGSWLGCR
jgi:hypothetical protein